MKKLLNKNIIILSIFIIAVAAVIIQVAYEEKLIRSDPSLTLGKIINSSKPPSGRLGRSYTYEFVVNSQKFKGSFYESSFCERYRSYQEDLEIAKSKIPVIYYKQNPKINEMLLKKIQYSKYDLKYPDSLKVFLNKYFNCD